MLPTIRANSKMALRCRDAIKSNSHLCLLFIHSGRQFQSIWRWSHLIALRHKICWINFPPDFFLCSILYLIILKYGVLYKFFFYFSIQSPFDSIQLHYIIILRRELFYPFLRMLCKSPSMCKQRWVEKWFAYSWSFSFAYSFVQPS